MHDSLTEQIRQWVTDALEAERVGARRFEEDHGLKKWALRGLLDPERKQAPSVDKAREICEALGLEFYVGPPRPVVVGDQAAPEFVNIPLYEASLAAGGGTLNGPDHVRGHLAFRQDWLMKLGLGPSNAVLAKVDGDSMLPSIHPGDLALINRSKTEVPIRKRNENDTRPPPIYAFLDDGNARLKRIERPEEDLIILLSDNPLYGPEIVGADKLAMLNVIGQVAWWAHTVRE